MKKTKEKAKDKLTLKQKLFCDWYLKLGGSQHATEAAKRAGYSQKTAYSIASENLKRPEVKAYLEERKKKIEEVLGFNKMTLIEDLHKIKSMSMKAVPVMTYDRVEREMVQVTEEKEDGEEVGVFVYDSNGANRAIENISKMMGYNEPEKVEDVTPLDRKAPTTVVVNKTYDKESDQPGA